jgi:GT2 family glycosyltransferase
LTPPYWEPGGKGELNWRNTGKGDGRWFFIIGGAWMIRRAVLRELDWPDRRLAKNGDDVFLGEALRQAGYGFAGLRDLRVDLGHEERRGQAW